MRAKFVNEFQRGIDPKKAMGIGMSERFKELLNKVDVEKYFKENGLDMNNPQSDIILDDVELDDQYVKEMSDDYNISFETRGDEFGPWYVTGTYYDILRFMVDERFLANKKIWERDKWGDTEDFILYAKHGIGRFKPIEYFLKVNEEARYAPKVVDYEKVAKPYKPDEIKHLIIGEAPPHENPENYFYVPRKKGVGTGYQGFSQSLPGLVFKKFLGYVPTNEEEYIEALGELRSKGVYLIDLVTDPLIVSERIKQRGKRDKTVVDPAAVEVLVNAVPKLKERVNKLEVPDENIILLNLRSRVNTALKRAFPRAKIYKSWKQFLTNH